LLKIVIKNKKTEIS